AVQLHHQRHRLLHRLTQYLLLPTAEGGIMRKTSTLAAVAVTAIAFVAATVNTASAAVPPTPTAASTIATGLNVPWGLAFLPDGSALVSERNSAQIKRIASDGTVTTIGTVP